MTQLVSIGGELYHADDFTDEQLEHYGVKGMKWGRRKARSAGQSIRNGARRTFTKQNMKRAAIGAAGLAVAGAGAYGAYKYGSARRGGLSRGTAARAMTGAYGDLARSGARRVSGSRPVAGARKAYRQTAFGGARKTGFGVKTAARLQRDQSVRATRRAAGAAGARLRSAPGAARNAAGRARGVASNAAGRARGAASNAKFAYNNSTYKVGRQMGFDRRTALGAQKLTAKQGARSVASAAKSRARSAGSRVANSRAGLATQVAGYTARQTASKAGSRARSGARRATGTARNYASTARSRRRYQ